MKRQNSFEILLTESKGRSRDEMELIEQNDLENIRVLERDRENAFD